MLALWDATGFGTAASNDGFTRLYYAPADMDDYASRTARNASLEHSIMPEIEPYIEPETGEETRACVPRAAGVYPFL